MPVATAPPTTTTSKIDEQVEALFQCLPADSIEEIAIGMTRQLSYRVSYETANQVVFHLRKHADKYGWTIPPVKRGPPKPGETGRFFAVLCENDGSFYFDPASRKHLDRGAHAQTATAASQLLNLATAFRFSIDSERSRIRKEMLSDLEEAILFLAKRARRMAKKMAEAEAA